MNTQITEAFKSLLPENIKQDPFLLDVIETYCEFLEENSKVSLDISQIMEKEEKVFREEYLKIYLDDLYRVFKAAETSPLISEKIESVNASLGYTLIERDFIGDITNRLSNEHLITSKSFKQKKGTRVGIEYIYNLIEDMDISQSAKGNFKLEEGAPFQMDIEGSIYKEMYDQIVKPVAHPLGWTYIYEQILKTILQDTFNIETIYNVTATEVRCLDGYFHVFTEAADDTAVKADFLGRINALTGSLFTEAEYNTYVTVVTNKTVDTLDLEDRNGAAYRQVLFTDGTYVEQYFDPISVSYKDTNGTETESDDTVLQEYANHCSLYLEYTFTENILTLDEITEEVDFYIGMIKEENSGNVENTEWKRDSDEYAFTVGGTKTLYELNDKYIDTGKTAGDFYTDPEAEACIAIGREWRIADTSDVHDMTSEDFVTEEFTISLIPA